MSKNIQRNMHETLPVAIILSVSGGLMDAYSYICRGQVFANAQTGNILLFGVNLTTGNSHMALRYLMPVLAFALGIAASEILQHIFRDRHLLHWSQVSLAAEIVILASVAFIPQSLNLLANSLTSFACGIQVESFRRLNGSGIATTMCIGNLRCAVQSLCDYSYTKNKRSIRNSFIYFCLICMFVIGAVIGNACVKAIGEKAILVSCSLLIIDLIIILAKNNKIAAS